MKVTTEDLGNREVLIKVEFDEAEKAEALKEAAQIISQEITIPGFRKGKAPYDVVRRMVGERLIYNIAFENLSGKIYPKLISDLNLEPIAPGQVQEVSVEPFSITFKVPLKPVVDLGDYHSLRVKPKETDVSEEEIEQVLRDLQEEKATWISVERSATLGDLIIADLAFKSGDQEDQRENVPLYLDPRTEPIKGLSQNLEGLAPGDEKTFALEGDKGEITFRVKVHEVKEKILPPLDDEFARSLGDFNSLSELKEQIRADLMARRARLNREEAFVEALETLVNNAKVEMPSLLVEEKIEEIIQEEDKAWRKRGLSLENYLKMQGKTLEDYRRELYPKATERLKRALVLRKFIEAENIKVSEEEMEKVIKNFEAGITSRRGKRAVRSPEFRDNIASALLQAKVEDRLLEIMLKEESDEGKSNNPDGD